MHLRRTRTGVVIHAPAKINLFFEVLNRRSDGYHEVETLVYPIDLCDTIVLAARTDGEIRFRLSRDPLGPVGVDVPQDGSNLVVRALELLRRQAGATLGADVLLRKRIPSAAGLGGGSSDAAAALAGANVAWRLDWPAERLERIGAELGSDVPLFLRRGASVCRGRGEIVERLPTTPVFHLVVVRPPEGLSTADVYGACRIPWSPRPLRPLIEAFASADPSKVGRAMFNRLEPAAEALSPWIHRVRAAFDRVDCLGAQMTGSGSCYFGLCRHARHARRIARRLEAYGTGRAFVARGCP